MDKYEFNLRVNQIKILVNRGDYRTAMKIADIIDWKRVKNASLLCKISQIYEMNEAYKKAADILRMTWGLMAQDDEGLYQILYKYMELAIKRGDSISTKSTYDMFCSLCNEEDPRQYLLYYMLLKAKSVWLEERSHWLEYITEKKCDKNLLYGIADLYHKIAEERLFVAACDNILYSLDCSQDNKYIEKAMSLKSRQVIEINNRVKLSGNMYEGEEPYIFISYSHNEPERVFPIVATMQKKGYRIWLDKGIIPAKSWGKDITQHIKNCAFFLAFISENYLSSENCLDELMYARKQDMPKLLVHLEKVKLPDEVDMRYGRIQGILLYTCMMQEEFYKKLDKADGILCCNILEHN